MGSPLSARHSRRMRLFSTPGVHGLGCSADAFSRTATSKALPEAMTFSVLAAHLPAATVTGRFDAVVPSALALFAHLRLQIARAPLHAMTFEALTVMEDVLQLGTTLYDFAEWNHAASLGRTIQSPTVLGARSTAEPLRLTTVNSRVRRNHRWPPFQVGIACWSWLEALPLQPRKK